MDDVILNKSESIKRCILRIEQDYDEEFENNYTKQDSVILNIQRAIQQAIDLGAYIVKKYKFKIPKTSREIFEILFENQIIDKKLSENLKKMVGFRNLAIHEYTQLNLEIIKYIIQNQLWDIVEFEKIIIQYEKGKNETKSND